MAIKYQAKNVDEGKWNATNFNDFKDLMNEFRIKLQEINDSSMSQQQKRKVKKTLRHKRTEIVQSLLNGKRYEAGAFQELVQTMKAQRG